MRRHLLFPLILLLTATLPLGGQNVGDLIISEILAQSDSTGLIDDYGRRGGWIELFNTSTGTVNYGGCYLTDDPADLRKSLIPKGDQRTRLGPRQAVVFYASGHGADGTFYAGFTLTPGETVYLVSNDGRTIIDSLSIPASLPAGRSVRKEAHDLRQMVFEPVDEATVPSPGIPNGNQEAESKAQNMAAKDPHGWILALVSVSVVFSALTILWGLFVLLFKLLGRSKGTSGRKRKQAATPDGEVAAAIAAALDMEADGDLYAAIATAVHLHLSASVHDGESYRLTIRRVSSPWSDKRALFRTSPKQKT